MRLRPGIALATTLITLAACGTSTDSGKSSGDSSRTTTSAATTTSALPSTESTPQPTPQQAALAWFAGINQKDQSRVTAAFTANAGVRLAWTTNPPPAWPTFSSIKCAPQYQSATTASVSCTFTESQAPAAGNPDSFWNISFQRQTGRWLIDNYGQG